MEQVSRLDEQSDGDLVEMFLLGIVAPNPRRSKAMQYVVREIVVPQFLSLLLSFAVEKAI